MQHKTLVLLVLLKWAELAFQITMFGLMIDGTVRLFSQLGDQGIELKIQSCFAVVFAFYTVVYNNLLINLRFKCSRDCLPFRSCIFDLFNFAYCQCFLLKICMDRPRL